MTIPAIAAYLILAAGLVANRFAEIGWAAGPKLASAMRIGGYHSRRYNNEDIGRVIYTSGIPEKLG